MYRALDMSCKVAVYGSRKAADGSRGAVESSRGAVVGSRGAVDCLQMSRLQTRVVERIPNTNEYRIPTNTEYQRIVGRIVNEYRIPTNTEYQRIPNTEYQRIVNEYRVPIIRCSLVFVQLFVGIRYSLLFGIR